MTDELRETLIARTLGMQGKSKEETIDDVEKEANRIGVVAKTMDAAKQLSGTNALQEELNKKDKKIEAEQERADKATEAAHQAQIQGVKVELGAKIDKLAESYTGGASTQTISGQIAEIKKAADQLNLGGSKVSEIKDMMTLIESLNPRKSLLEQIKDAKELITVFQPQKEENKDFTIGGMPASIALELKKMDTNLQITLESMKDERQRRDQEFKLKIKQYDDERDLRVQEANARIQVEQDRNKMFGGAVDTLGRAIGKGAAEAGRESARPGAPVSGQGQRGQQQPKTYHIELAENEKADFDCPLCKTRMAVGPDTTIAECASCHAKYPIVRSTANPADAAAAAAAAVNPEPILEEEQ